MTNRELITAALRMLDVLDADESASYEDSSLALQTLNDTMLDLASEGVDLGYPPQDDVSDDFPLGDSEAAAIKPIFAMRLMIHYPSRQPPPMLPLLAERNERRLTRDAVLASMEEADMSNIPRGEGNGYRSSILTDD
jgi:hypothetical protein